MTDLTNLFESITALVHRIFFFISFSDSLRKKLFFFNSVFKLIEGSFPSGKLNLILLPAIIAISIFSLPALAQVQDHPLSQIRGPFDVNLNMSGTNITNTSYIFWGNNTNDANLYRPAADVLGTDDIFRLVTTGTAGALQFVDANVRLYRSSNDLLIEASGQLRLPKNTNITGALYVINNSPATSYNGTIYLGKT